MREVAERFGLELDRSGFARCPFHDETDASFRVYDYDFHCFGCKAHGDQIDFIQRMDRCDFRTAAETLARFAGTSLDLRYKHQSSWRALRQKAKKNIQENKLKKLWDELGKYMREHAEIASILGRKPKDPSELTDEYCNALRRKSIVEYQIETLNYQIEEEEKRRGI